MQLRVWTTMAWMAVALAAAGSAMAQEHEHEPGKEKAEQQAPGGHDAHASHAEHAGGTRVAVLDERGIGHIAPAGKDPDARGAPDGWGVAADGSRRGLSVSSSTNRESAGAARAAASIGGC